MKVVNKAFFVAVFLGVSAMFPAVGFATQIYCPDPNVPVNGKPLIWCNSTLGCISSDKKWIVSTTSGQPPSDSCTFAFYLAEVSTDFIFICRYHSPDCKIGVDLISADYGYGRITPCPGPGLSWVQQGSASTCRSDDLTKCPGCL